VALFVPQFQAELDTFLSHRRRRPATNDALAFFERAVRELSPGARDRCRIGPGGNAFALVVGNYFLCAITPAAACIASLVPPPRRAVTAWTFASAAQPAVLHGYPVEAVEYLPAVDDAWHTYGIVADALCASRQGMSDLFLTARVRTPLAHVLAGTLSARAP
jgi:hypothetical protein